MKETTHLLDKGKLLVYGTKHPHKPVACMPNPHPNRGYGFGYFVKLVPNDLAELHITMNGQEKVMNLQDCGKFWLPA